MTRAPSQRIAWRRILVESLAVVLSILLAFSIDAWWDGYQEQRRERRLLVSLLDDFRSSRPGLQGRLVLAQRMAAGNARFGALLRGVGRGVPVPVPDSLILAVLSGPTYEPVTDALEAALASGEIELLSSADLRAQLASWRRTLADTGEDELEVRRITNQQVVPELAKVVNLQPYFDVTLAWAGGDPFGVGRAEAGGPAAAYGHAAIPASTELAGALAVRQFYAQFAAADLEELLAHLDRIVAMVENELGG